MDRFCNPVDFKTSTYCSIDAKSGYLKVLLASLHPEVPAHFYGSPLDSALYGNTVLDLDCCSVHDCYLLSNLVGPKGRVTDVDDTGTAGSGNASPRLA